LLVCPVLFFVVSAGPCSKLALDVNFLKGLYVLSDRGEGGLRVQGGVFRAWLEHHAVLLKELKALLEDWK